MFQSIRYQPLTKEENRSSMESCHACHCLPSRYTRREMNIATIFATLLILSNLSTWIFSNRLCKSALPFNLGYTTTYGMFLLSSEFKLTCQLFLAANLDRNIPIAFEEHTQYTDHNETLAKELWDQINIDAGMVALPDEFVATNGLPVAQRFPWDRSKGIYLLNGHHNLHCIVRKNSMPFFSRYTILAGSRTNGILESNLHLAHGILAGRATDTNLGPCNSLCRFAAPRHHLQRRRYTTLLHRD